MATDKKISAEPIYTLSIASKLSGIPSHSIRQYIEKGLIIPFRTKTSRHLFSDIEISRLKTIKKLLHEDNINIAGIKAIHALIPCWALKPCTPEEKESCGAYVSDSEPCWNASDKSLLCKNTDCRSCHVYTYLAEYEGFKSIFREIFD